MSNFEEIMTKNDDNRYVVFPIRRNDLWKMYKDSQGAFWTAEEMDLSKDDFDGLNEEEKHYIKHILAFFAASDGIVNQNIAENFINEIGFVEAKIYYGFQIAMENIHSEVYSLLIDTYIKNEEEKNRLFRAIETMPSIMKKAEWAIKWIESENILERLIAFSVVEGIFFSSSFASIFWLRTQGKLPGLCFANDLISRDENMHTDFAIHLYNNYGVNKLSEERIKEIVLGAYEIEKEFVLESLPVRLIGMNSDSMVKYLQYVVDTHLKKLNLSPIFKATSPFTFMETIAIPTKRNFFEGRVNEYQRGNSDGMDGNKITFDADF